MSNINVYKLYMAVTPDKFELPLAVADSLEELSKITGIARGNIAANISKGRSGGKIGMKFVRVQVMYDNYEW